MRKLSVLTILFIVFFLSFNSLSWSQKSSKWELEVNTEKADVHLVPDTESTVVIILPKGFPLKSYEKINEWFRVIIGPDEDGIVTIGYIQSQNVDVIREKIVKELDFWEEEPEFFKGIGLSVRLTGGPLFFNGGDIRKGSQGLYESAYDFISSYGYSIERRYEGFNSGFEVTVDVVYHFTSKLGMTIGFGYMRALEQSFLHFRQPGGYDIDYIDSAPEISVFPIKLGLYLTLPLHRLVNFTLNSGAALYIAEYGYGRRTTWETISRVYHNANATGLGVHGGLGFEINFHRRAALILEAQGRYARISGFDGKGKTTTSRLFPLPDLEVEENGALYYLEGDNHPNLMFKENEPTGYQTVRKATLDLSGFVFRAGIKVMF